MEQAVVSLGDSYIAGEAGRWQGNATNPDGDRYGTDRAYVAPPDGPRYDPTRVYGPPTNAWHRADIAEIHQLRDRSSPARINLACSGATTGNVLRASAGGSGYEGEPPQNDQLANVARQYRVKTVVLSIGGSDIGSRTIISSCVIASITKGTPCNATLQPELDRSLPLMRAAVGRTIDDIRATFADAGYRTDAYRLVLQSYPNPLPRSAKFRYPERN